MRVIEQAADVDKQVLDAAESVWEGWFADEPRIDWDAFIDRLAELGHVSNPPFDFEEFWNPAVRKIQRHVSQWRAES